MKKFFIFIWMSLFFLSCNKDIAEISSFTAYINGEYLPKNGQTIIKSDSYEPDYINGIRVYRNNISGYDLNLSKDNFNNYYLKVYYFKDTLHFLSWIYNGKYTISNNKLTGVFKSNTDDNYINFYNINIK